MSSDRERLCEIIKGFGTVVLITRGRASAAGALGLADWRSGLDARPMALSRVEPDCQLWFLTAANTRKVRDIATDPRVHVIGVQGRERCVSLSGTATVMRDPYMTRELWSDLDRVWFPSGPNDHDLRVIHMRTQTAEYWEAAHLDRIRFVLEPSKAYVSGHRPTFNDSSQHGEVRL